ncbi:MAG: PrgI family protein, partial [Candidatus Saccharimonadales bacterium]
MAVYKVIQDVEAEDKLLGPLTLKGFIYAVIVVFLGYINFRLVLATGLGLFRWAVILTLLLPMILFGVLASPLGRDQPTEVWLLSHIKFLLKPRRRVWSQSGISQLVTITAPKRVQERLTKDFSPNEVQSRLQALATTLDSRGWAVKNANLNMASTPPANITTEAGSDRLIDSPEPTTGAPIIDVRAEDDILDENSNPTAQNFQVMMEQADLDRKQAARERLEAARQSKLEPTRASNPTPRNALTKEEEQLLDKLHQQDRLLKTQHPVIISHGHSPQGNQTAASVTTPARADKLELAQSGNDLSVAS